MAEIKEILKARARILAERPHDQRRRVDEIQVVEFLVAHETYAVESAYVREVYPLKDLTPLPGTPNFILGVIGIRGRVISIVDLKKFFELPDHGLTDFNRVIVMTDGQMEFGLLTDAIVGLRSIAVGEMQSSLPTLTGVRLDFLKGVTAEPCVVLDSARLLSDPRLLVHQTVE